MQGIEDMADDFLIPDHAGAMYQDCLREMHETLAPRTYLEVGTLHGETLAIASCASLAIDPNFQLHQPAVGGKPACHFYQMASDAFFAQQDPGQIFGRPVDLAFLDGMHLFEYLLRDFINIERVCTRGSVIVLHDCVPSDLYMAVRDVNDTATRALSAHPEWWTGDVWKTVEALHRHRPDLRIQAFDAPPSGLILVSNLDPASRVLTDRYPVILSQMQALRHANDYRAYLNWLQPRPTTELPAALAALKRR